MFEQITIQEFDTFRFMNPKWQSSKVPSSLWPQEARLIAKEQKRVTFVIWKRQVYRHSFHHEQFFILCLAFVVYQVIRTWRNTIKLVDFKCTSYCHLSYYQFEPHQRNQKRVLVFTGDIDLNLHVVLNFSYRNEASSKTNLYTINKILISYMSKTKSSNTYNKITVERT